MFRINIERDVYDTHYVIEFGICEGKLVAHSHKELADIFNRAIKNAFGEEEKKK